MGKTQNLNLFFGLLIGFLSSITATSGASVTSLSPMICDLETALSNETWGAYRVVEDQRSDAFNDDVQVGLFLPVVSGAGCTDDTACNYDAEATESDNNLCVYPEAGLDCDGNCVIEGTYLYLDVYDCSQYSPFEVTEANSPGVISGFEFIIDGNGGVIINEFIPGQGFMQQSTSYTFDNCVLNVQGFGDFEPQADGSFIAQGLNNPDVCRAIIEGTIGCIDPNACNYDPNAYADAGNFVGGSICEYPTWGADCAGNCSVDDVSGTSWNLNSATAPVSSLEDPEVIALIENNALTFIADGSIQSSHYTESNLTWTQDCGQILIEGSNGEAYYLFVIDNGNALYTQEYDADLDAFNDFLFTPFIGTTGCTDDIACNYDVEATESDNTLCIYPDQGFDCDGNLIVVMGCTYQNADNYNAEANEDDGSCVFSPSPVLGCTDETAANYHAAATQDDGSCLYGTIVSCFGDFNNDSAINSGDLLMFLGVFGTSCE